MGEKYKRRNYLIHPSSQLKFIAFAILPALVMTLFCAYYMNMTGDMILQLENDKIFAKLSAINKTVPRIEETTTKDTEDDVRRLKDILDSFEDAVLLAYSKAPRKWNQAKVLVFSGLFCVLLGTAMLALLYSHRIAGPLYRLGRCIDMLSEGKDLPPIRARRNDEFKELLESLDKLRENLKNRGFLESEE